MTRRPHRCRRNDAQPFRGGSRRDRAESRLARAVRPALAIRAALTTRALLPPKGDRSGGSFRSDRGRCGAGVCRPATVGALPAARSVGRRAARAAIALRRDNTGSVAAGRTTRNGLRRHAVAATKKAARTNHPNRGGCVTSHRPNRGRDTGAAVRAAHESLCVHSRRCAEHRQGEGKTERFSFGFREHRAMPLRRRGRLPVNSGGSLWVRVGRQSP